MEERPRRDRGAPRRRGRGRGGRAERGGLPRHGLDTGLALVLRPKAPPQQDFPSTPQKTKLTSLPPEILGQVISHATTARFLRNLALTSRALNEIVKSEGWKMFTLAQFPSFTAPPYWKDAAHALTTLSRNFDRKAFIAENFPPSFNPVHTLPNCKVRDRWHGPGGQTMGYQPVLDSYEEWTGRKWDLRKEVVAWGAGAELVMKTIDWGGRIFTEDERKKTKRPFWGNARTKHEWMTYKDPVYVEGRDDITTLKLLRPEQRPGPVVFYGNEHAVVGRANGELTLLRLVKDDPDCIVRQFNTQCTPVLSADVSMGSAPLLLACLGDSRAALYNVNGEERQVKPMSTVQYVGELEKNCRTWTTQWLSTDTVAIGRGLTKNPVYVYQIAPDGISKEPVRVFGSGKGQAEGVATSVYPIVKIPSSSSDTEYQAFFSGGLDGKIRLHDMRSSSNCEAILEDPTEFSAIFSLLMVGRERLLAGGAANALLKVFDLRMMGGRVYSYTDIAQKAQAPPQKNRVNPDVGEPDPIYGSGWNLFSSPSRQADMSYRTNRRTADSPIYSLTSPSPYSPNVYVGVEGNVIHLNFTDSLDKHPDPLFRRSMYGNMRANFLVSRTWDPSKRVLNLNMYDQNPAGDLPLRMQRPIGDQCPVEETLPGRDERWYNPAQYRNITRWPRNTT